MLAPFLALLLCSVPLAGVLATDEPSVRVDDALGNVIASGDVVRWEPTRAIVTVTNHYRFWAAIDLGPRGGAFGLRPADPREHLGGVFAWGGLIGPGATAAYVATFDPTKGGSASVRVHYDLSAGGAAAVAGDVLTVVAIALGAGLVLDSGPRLLLALEAIERLPDFAEIVGANQEGPTQLTDIVPVVKVLLGTETGRATLIYALGQLGVSATQAGLKVLARGWTIGDIGVMAWDLLTASLLGHTDGTVVFSARVVDAPGPGTDGEPVRRPAGLPARVPWADGERHMIAPSDDPASPDGFGFSVVAADGTDPVDATTVAHPLFGGTLVLAGCATGPSAHLGRVVAIERVHDGHRYHAVYAHLSSIDPALTGGPTGMSVGADRPIGRFGSSVTAPDGTCDGSDGSPPRLTVLLLRDSSVTNAGAITGGTPVKPEPLLGAGLYEQFAWWRGPMTAAPMGEAAAAPRVTWAKGTTRDTAHVAFGDKVVLAARVDDTAELREVRFTAYHPDWANARQAGELPGFDLKRTWRIVAVCRPEGLRGEPPTTKGCSWDGDRRSATVTYLWDPTAGEQERSVPWLPRADPAITTDSEGCVPVTLGIDVVDDSGYRASAAGGRIAGRCDATAEGLGRAAYLDPPSPPDTPTGLRHSLLWKQIECPGRGFCRYPYRLSWNDVDGELGYRIYVENGYTDGVGCPDEHSGTTKRRLLATVTPETTSWRGTFTPEVTKIGGFEVLINWSNYYVASFNRYGESRPRGPVTEVYADPPECYEW